MRNVLSVSSVIIVCTMVSAMPAQGVLIADAGGDWVPSDGATAGSVVGGTGAGWTYLSSDAANGGAELLLVAATQTGAVGGPGFGPSDLGSNTTIPAVQGDNANGGDYELFVDGDLNGSVAGTDLLFIPSSGGFIIARYNVSAADVLNGTSATIAGSFRDLVEESFDSAPGGVFVYHNDSQLFSAFGSPRILTQAAGTFNLNATVGVGDTIDFVVGAGPSNGGDEFALRATIDVVPEPASLALMGLGGLMILRRRRHA